MAGRRNPSALPYMADGCTPLPGGVPWGSGPNFQAGRQTNQAANTTRLLTQYPFLAPEGVTPWSYYDGGPYERQSTRSVEAVTAEGGPVTWVATVNGRELLRQVEDDPTFLPVDKETITAQGSTRTRVQAIIEWSTGTGTNEWVCVDVNQGVVFRVFGTVCRIHPFFYPPSPVNDEAPVTSIITDREPVPLQTLGIGFKAATVVQASVQTSKNRSEGFPGSWQCTAGLTPVITSTFVPPFARSVQIEQVAGGAIIPLYEWIDAFGNVVGTISREPGTRQTSRAAVPWGAERLSIPGSTPGFCSAVFEVSQF